MLKLRVRLFVVVCVTWFLVGCVSGDTEAPAAGLDAGDVEKATDTGADAATAEPDGSSESPVLPAGSFLFGVSSRLPTENEFARRTQLDMGGAAGIQIFRRDINWDVIEVEDGVFNVEAYDAMVDDTLAHGHSILGMLGFGVDWAMGIDDHDSIDPADFAEFVSRTVAHYKGRIRYWEVWNEENWIVFWKPTPSPEAYGDLLKAAYTAAHEADPDCVVSFGGMSPTDFIMGEMWKFLEDVYTAHPDIADYFDAVAIHPYTMLQVLCPEEEGENGSVAQQVRHAYEILERHGDTDKPIWITESGWPACPCPPHDPPSRNVTWEQQAQYMVRGNILAISEGAQLLVWYTFADGQPGPDSTSESYFGLVQWDEDPSADPPPGPKPAYHAYAGMTSRLAGMCYESDLREELLLDEAAYGFRFRAPDGSRHVDVLWTSEPGGEVPISYDSSPSGDIAVRGMYGDAIDVDSSEGTLAVTATESPLYVVVKHLAM